MTIVPDWLQEWLPILEALSYLAVIVGVPLAVVNFLIATAREAKAREYGTYDALDQKFLDYQRLCLEHPDLDIFDVQDGTPQRIAAAGDEQLRREKRELIAFTILFSTFERAFLMYLDKSEEVRRNQFAGWGEYIDSFCARDNFRRAWSSSGATFDVRFQDEMEGRLQAARRSPEKTTLGATIVKAADSDR